jgi:hypothetical protein
MNDYNLVLATFIAAVLNLEVNIEILEMSKKRYEQSLKQNEKLGEIIELFKGEKNAGII